MDVSTGEMLLTVEAYELSVDPTTITASSTSTSTSTEAADLNLGSGQPPRQQPMLSDLPERRPPMNM